MSNISPTYSPFSAAIGRAPRPSPDTGLTDAGQLYLIANHMAGFAMDILRREGFLSKIANTEALKPLEEFGQVITFRVLKPPSTHAYIVNQDLVPETVDATNFSVSVDHAIYTFPTLDPVDIKQINLPLLEKIAKLMADGFAEYEYQTVVAGLVAMVYSASAMSYHGQTPGTVYYNPSVPTSVSVGDRTAGSDYIINQFIAAMIAANKMGVSKKGRYAMVNSDVLQILLTSDQLTYQIAGAPNAKAIEDGDFGLRIAGYDIIVTDEIPTATYGGQTNIAQCVLGHRDGLGFIRQITQMDLNFKMQTKFNVAHRGLEVFGYGWSDSRLSGALPIKVA